ncbi:MAG: mechanosensitive ion channel [Nitrospira sp.]|nr:mechanosensitive ion channel [Nitrospira sp.]
MSERAEFYYHAGYSTRNIWSFLPPPTRRRQASPAGALIPERGSCWPIIRTFAAKLRLILILALSLIEVGPLSPLSAHAVELNLTMAASPVDRGAGGASKPGEIDMTALRERRKQAQTDLNTMRESLEFKSLTGPAREEEQQERRALLEQIVRGYDEQSSDFQRLTEARQRHADIVRSSSEWKGFPEPSPYSIFLADRLWDTVHSLKLAAEGLQSQRELLTLRFEQAREALTTAEERLRQASERLETTKDRGQVGRERRDYELAALRARAASVLLEAAQLSITRVEEELDGAKARLAFEQRQLDAVSPHVVFSEADLVQVRTRLAKERLRVEEQLEQSIVERQRQSQTVQQVEQRLHLLRNKQAGGKDAVEETPAISRAKAAVELARARMDNLVSQSDLLQQLMNVVEGERQLWENRFVIVHTSEPGKAREAHERFTPLFDNFRASRDYLRQQAGIISGQISEAENRMRHSSAPLRATLQDLIRTFHEREETYARALHRMDEAARFMERWREEFKQQQKEVPLFDRLEELLTRIGSLIQDAWRYELFSAEDTIEVDGKTMTGHRSVTVGKILTALAIFLIGYVVCVHLARAIGRLAVTRFGMAADVANLLRQWSQAFLIMFLIVLSFSWAKIPLTIFAFLGGAFAIGVGFGAQTLLKNIISGILLLIERPMRVGDLIEADNVRGRVTSIGLRSSTIRDAKGTETLIPNSSFLERTLTNWTYSSRVGRFSLRVGVPYDTAAQQIMNLLSALALQHPKVMKQPAPQVLLDEFGTQARIFTVNYWHEISPDVDPSGIASELRFAIEQKFAEAGLKVLPAI